MLREVIFRDDQKIVTSDLNNLSTFSRQSFDSLVANAVSSLRYYTGFAVTKSGQAEVTVAAGHYWAGGPVFVRSDATVFNFLTGGSYLPVVTRRKVAIVAYGETITTDVQERSFLINDQGETEPQSVAMERLRYARLALVSGAESPDPQKPTLDVGVIPIAWVTLSTTGVVDGGIEMAADFKLPSIESLKQVIAVIETWRAEIGQVVDTLQSELLRTQAAIPVDRSLDLARLALRIDALEKLARTPASSVKTFIENFFDAAGSDTAASGYSCNIDRGLRFPSVAPVNVKPALLNPNDARLKLKNDILLPAWTERVRISVLDFDTALPISQYPVTSYDRVQRYMSRIVWQHTQWPRGFNGGDTVSLASFLNTMFNDKAGDPASTAIVLDNLTAAQQAAFNANNVKTFTMKTIGGESYTVNMEKMFNINGWGERVESPYSAVTVLKQEPYWDVVSTTQNVSGATIAQTFKNVTNGWLTSINLYFAEVASTGDVFVELCEVVNGDPDPSRVIGRGSVAASALSASGAIKVSINPTHLLGGRDYAVIIRSLGNHRVQIALGNKYAQGTLFFRGGGGRWELVQNSGDLCMELAFAAFAETRTEIQFENLQLTGGIAAVKVLSAAFVPDGCDLIWEVQRAGVWYKISAGEAAALTGSPANVAFRAVFIGTTDLMPGLDLGQTEIELTRLLSSLVHVSSARVLSAASTSIQVHCYIDNWDATAHALTCTLVGTSGEPVSPVGTITDVDPDFPRKVRRRFTFTPTSTASFKVRLAGSTSDLAKVFSVSQRYDFAF